MKKKDSKSAFKVKLDRLQQISEALESDELEIEEAIQLYEEGVKLASECMQTLKEAELKVSTLKSSFLVSSNEEEKENENE